MALVVASPLRYSLLSGALAAAQATLQRVEDGAHPDEVKAAEAALRASEEQARQLSMVAARTDNAVILTDRQGDTQWVNESFTRISGFTAEVLAENRPMQAVLNKSEFKVTSKPSEGVYSFRMEFA